MTRLSMLARVDLRELAASGPSRSADRGGVGRYTQQAGLAACVVALGVFFTLKNGDFASHGNLIELLRSATLYFIVACPSTLLLVGGGLDFSVGAVFPLGAVSAGLLITHGTPWPIALLGGVAVGVAVGLINAAVSIYLHVPPLIATIGSFFFAGGIAVVITNGVDVYGFPNSFIEIGSGDLAGIPYLILYAAAIGVLFHVLLEKTVFGYNVRSAGGNRDAAEANAIRVARLDMALYAISGGVAALAGILGAARLSTASPESGGAGFTFQVITAVIVGGTSLFGGVGTVGGSALGAVLFAELNNGLQVINVNPLYQSIFIGVILIAAVSVDQFRRRRRFRAGR